MRLQPHKSSVKYSHHHKVAIFTVYLYDLRTKHGEDDTFKRRIKEAIEIHC